MTPNERVEQLERKMDMAYMYYKGQTKDVLTTEEDIAVFKKAVTNLVARLPDAERKWMALEGFVKSAIENDLEISIKAVYGWMRELNENKI